MNGLEWKEAILGFPWLCICIMWHKKCYTNVMEVRLLCKSSSNCLFPPVKKRSKLRGKKLKFTDKKTFRVSREWFVSDSRRRRSTLCQQLDFIFSRLFCQTSGLLAKAPRGSQKQRQGGLMALKL